ncbi:MAG: hydrolase [Nanoarchaeota archaeon]|nr:hydrolase [Nanoarchaeota archaeon]
MVPKEDLGILRKDNSILLVIDIQEKFRPVIHSWDKLIDNMGKLINSLQILKIPLLLTEQYPKGLGKTCSEITEILSEYKPIEKKEFSCLKNKEFLSQLKKLNKNNIIICGIEAHVCVVNTLLEAISQGFNVHLVVDAISSRKKADLNVAIGRSKQAGAFLTTVEMAIFQLMGSSGAEEFRKISKIVK